MCRFLSSPFLQQAAYSFSWQRCSCYAMPQPACRETCFSVLQSLAVSAMAFREMCSVGDAKAVLETLAEYAQPALQGALLQMPEMQRVRLLELIADSLEPHAAEAFDRAHAKAPPPMPPALVDEEVLPGAGTVLLGMSPLGMLQVTMVRKIGPKAIHSQHLLQMTRRAPPSGPGPKTEASASDDTASAGRPGILKPEGVLLLLMLLHRLQMTASGACRKCPLLQMMTLPPLRRMLQVLLKSRFWWKPP